MANNKGEIIEAEAGRKRKETLSRVKLRSLREITTMLRRLLESMDSTLSHEEFETYGIQMFMIAWILGLSDSPSPKGEDAIERAWDDIKAVAGFEGLEP